MVWDIGTWENLGPEPHEGLEAGKLHFKLTGKKLKGEWALVKMHGPRATKGNEWLLLKHGKSMKPISSKQDDTSALSGRTMMELAGPRTRKWMSGRKAHEHARIELKSSQGSFKSRVATLANRTGLTRRTKKTKLK
jgi:bifunctional non-homologous end joining protein LigD